MSPLGAGRPSVADLPAEQVREALWALGRTDPPVGRPEAVDELRTLLGRAETLAGVLDAAPQGARPALARAAEEGPLTVRELLGREWWGRGRLPAPLDWLQVRALLVPVDPDAGLVDATVEAAAGMGVTAVDGPGPTGTAPTAELHRAACVLVGEPAGLAAALRVPEARLREVAEGVAVSDLPVERVRAALAHAGVALAGDAADGPGGGQGEEGDGVLPGLEPQAVGPAAVREALTRAAAEGLQVRLRYFASSRGGVASDRVVDAWRFADGHLVGWCHLRRDERTFALDRIGAAQVLSRPRTVEPPADGAR